MRTLAFSVILLCVAGCASVTVPAMSAADVVAMSKEGKSPKEIIAELQRTDTVLALRASDYVALHDAGVSDEVLNYLQSAQIEDALWRERSMYWGWNSPGWGFYGRGGCRGRRC